jgi:hypothetical protein
MPKLIKIRESTSYIHIYILFRSKTIKINVYANKYLHLHQKNNNNNKERNKQQQQKILLENVMK